ncbi:MAG TPA: alpha/beta hydrolase [Candidatus Limnocylindria bacterium]|nr:alpha/beta hydrolase [Candidatus Limnocylindria bacterium]
MPLDPQCRLILDQLAATGMAPLHTQTVAEARAFMESMRGLHGPPTTLPVVRDLSLPGTAGTIPARLYRPVEGGTLPLLVYFHGGGWVIGSLDTHDDVCRDLAKAAGCAVLSVAYRLAPEHRFPAAAEDCYAATRWAAANGAALGIDPARLAVGGDSAGGNLAAVTALMARDQHGPALRFQLLIYPVTCGRMDSPSIHENADGYLLTRDAMVWFWDHYAPAKADRERPYAAPLRAADLHGLPPALVITAEFDPLRDEGEAYARRLEAAGVPTTLRRYDGQIHGFFTMGALIDRARDALAEAASALRAALA